MRLLFYIIIFFCFSMGIVSCGDDSTVNNNSGVSPEQNFKYPYSINSFWYYSTLNFVTNLRGDSIHNYFNTDTIYGSGAAEFVKDTIITGDTLRMLYNSHSAKGHSHTTIELYEEAENGLIRKASYSEGANFGPYRQADNFLKYSFNGRLFNSVDELFYFLRNEINDNQVTDSLIFDDPPVTALKYPVAGNTDWFFANSSAGEIHKKYLDYENVNLSGRTYYCIKIQRLYYPGGSQVPDSKLVYFDYFSKEGMVKRDFLVKDIPILNQSSDTVGIIDAKEEAYLNFFTP